MKRLEVLLSDLPQGEREEALQFYRDYFEDAGTENEQTAMESLGSPEQVAGSIHAELQGEHSGYGFAAKPFQMMKHGSPVTNEPKEDGSAGSADRRQQQTASRRRSAGEITLWIVLGILALPIAVPLVIALISLVFGLFGALVGIVAALMIGGLVAVIAGIVLALVAVVQIFVSPATGIFLMGGGLICAGIGILVIIPMIWAAGRLLPKAFHKITELCKRVFQSIKKHL